MPDVISYIIISNDVINDDDDKPHNINVQDHHHHHHYLPSSELTGDEQTSSYLTCYVSIMNIFKKTKRINVMMIERLSGAQDITSIHVDL